MEPKIIIFDLDGTLALIDARRKLAEKPNGKTNFDILFDPKLIKLDLPNTPIIECLLAHYWVGQRIIIMSGRSDITKEETIKWLDKHGVRYHNLIMRKNGDFTPDDKLKKDWLNQLPDKSNVLCVYDDRDKVVKMWREEGLTCIQVAEGNF